MSDDTFDPVLILSRLLRRQATQLAAPHACVLLIDSEGESLTIEYGIGIMEPYVGRIIQKGDGVAGYVLTTNQPHLIPDYLEWAQRYNRLIPDTRERINAVAGTPVYRNGAVWAVLSFIWEAIDRTKEASILTTLQEISANATALILRMQEITVEVESETGTIQGGESYLPGRNFLPAAL